MSRCYLCKTGDRVFCCDRCSNLVCDNCSSLTSSEIRCLELKKRSLLFHCRACLSEKHGLNVDLEDAFKSKMEEAIKGLTDVFEDFRTDFLKMASEKIADLVAVKRSPDPEPTYAAIAVRSTQQSVIVKPKDTNQKSSKTKLDLMTSLDPVGSDIKIKTVKHIRNGGLVVGCGGGEDAGRFVELAEDKLSTGYDVHILKKVLPRVRVVGISEDLPLDVLREYVLKQNEDVFRSGEDCQVLKISATKRNSGVYQATLQLNPITYDRVLKAGSLIIGFDVCRIYDAVSLIRCFKCSGFNHTSLSCSRAAACPRCGAGHEVKGCTVSDADLCCINCTRANEKSNKSFNTNHAVWDSQACPVFKEMLGKLKSDLFGTK